MIANEGGGKVQMKNLEQLSRLKGVGGRTVEGMRAGLGSLGLGTARVIGSGTGVDVIR